MFRIEHVTQMPRHFEEAESTSRDAKVVGRRSSYVIIAFAAQLIHVSILFMCFIQFHSHPLQYHLKKDCIRRIDFRRQSLISSKKPHLRSFLTFDHGAGVEIR